MRIAEIWLVQAGLTSVGVERVHRGQPWCHVVCRAGSCITGHQSSLHRRHEMARLNEPIFHDALPEH